MLLTDRVWKSAFSDSRQMGILEQSSSLVESCIENKDHSSPGAGTNTEVGLPPTAPNHAQLGPPPLPVPDCFGDTSQGTSCCQQLPPLHATKLMPLMRLQWGLPAPHSGSPPHSMSPQLQPASNLLQHLELC